MLDAAPSTGSSIQMSENYFGPSAAHQDIKSYQGNSTHSYKNLGLQNTDGMGSINKDLKAKEWWHMPSILALRRQRQVDLSFEASLVYTASTTQRNPFLKKKTKQKNLC